MSDGFADLGDGRLWYERTALDFLAFAGWGSGR